MTMEPTADNCRTTAGQLRTTAKVQLTDNWEYNTPLGVLSPCPCTPGQLASTPVNQNLLDESPSTWNGPHVGRRLTEAMCTLRLMPMGLSCGYGSTWPPYSYEWQDLLAQSEGHELERTQQLQNRTRLLPSLAEITRMEIAIVWPAQFLARAAQLVVAVNAVALAHALDRDSGWVAAKRGGYADTWRQRHDQGCEIIAHGLRNNRVSVF
jgi:hypothetical protein